MKKNKDTNKGGLSDADRKLLKAHAINMNDGRLTESGDFHTSKDDVEKLFRKRLPDALETSQQEGRPLRVLFFGHGGLVKEESAINQALAHIPIWVEAGIYPIFFIWETGFVKSLKDAIFKGEGEREFRTRGELTDKFWEKFGHWPGNLVWGRMKENAEFTADADVGGAWITAKELARFTKASSSNDVELYALGHSAGSILHSHFIPAAIDAGVDRFDELFLLAPAIRSDAFKQRLAPLVGSAIRHCSMFTMDEETELDDRVGHYGKSLLYFVSRSFEPDTPTPILGLEESIRADRALVDLFLSSGSAGEMIWSPTSHSDGTSATNSSTHGGFGNEHITLNSIARRMLDDESVSPFPADFKTRGLDPDEFADVQIAGGGPAPAAQGPTKRALCVGIDKYESAPLAGCVNDARSWASTFESLGFDEVDLLLDEGATRAAIMNAFSERITASRPGDVLAFQFACHGTQVDDVNGDEKEDFLDEALVPFDYELGRFIIDDDLAELFNQIPQGVNVTLFMDCCHSHSNTRAFGAGAPPPLEPGQRMRFLPIRGEVMERHVKFRTARPTQKARDQGTTMREVNFAACRAEQTAKEANGSGYFTTTATTLIRENAARTHAELLAALQADFPLPVASQEPKLHCDPSNRDKILFASERAPTGGDGTAPSSTPGAPKTTPAGAERPALDPAVIAETMRDYIKLLLRLT